MELIAVILGTVALFLLFSCRMTTGDCYMRIVEGECIVAECWDGHGISCWFAHLGDCKRGEVT